MRFQTLSRSGDPVASPPCLFGGARLRRAFGSLSARQSLAPPGDRAPGRQLRAGLLLLLLLLLPVCLRADGVSELAAFSVFDKIDLADLAKSDVKTAHGPPMSEARFLSVQSCYVAPGNPARQLEALRQWNPLKHRELKVFLHADVRANASPADFAKLKSAPDNATVRSLVNATTKMSSELQLSREEAKTFSGDAGGGGSMPAAVADFWSNLLSNRVRSFSSGGAAAQPPYDHSGDSLEPAREFAGLLKQQEKIRRQFSGFLGQTGIGRGPGSSPELYWELLEVDDQGVLTLGASYARGGGDGPYQAADVLYYASGGYYVGLTLYQMWPVTVDGKASTLVWRGDMISSAALASLHGVERLASESAMMKDISRSVTLFRRDSSGK